MMSAGAVKAGAVALGAASAVEPQMQLIYLTLPFFDVSLATLGMATAGSLLAFAYGTPIKSRWKLLGYSVGGIFVGVWGVQLLPLVMGWKWYRPEVEPALAGAIALVSRWAIPLVVEHLPALWKRVFNTGPRE